ncbi:MAG TPA: hypothetical protein PLT95_06240, partial [Agitococcus sp.]|nr:hypothetical protein [Agitococcus sp.]
LEQSPNAQKAKQKPAPMQGGLFAEAVVVEKVVEKIIEKPQVSQVEQALKAIDIDNLTPRAALQRLYDLQALLMKS